MNTFDASLMLLLLRLASLVGSQVGGDPPDCLMPFPSVEEAILCSAPLWESAPYLASHTRHPAPY